MRALVLVTTSPGKSFSVQKKVVRVKGVEDALAVTGRADVAVFAKGTPKEISGTVKALWNIRGVVTTETLLQVV